MTEAEIIVQMRGSIEILKAKWQEAVGPWAVTDFLGAALHPEKEHWMRTIVRSEELSEPYLKASKK